MQQEATVTLPVDMRTGKGRLSAYETSFESGQTPGKISVQG
jgi:hypothetical protein